MSIQAEYREARIQGDLRRGALRELEGILQRVNYPNKELTVIAQGQVWYFTLDPDCQLWFDDKQAILRCFHPLDQVKVIYAESTSGHVIKAIYAWERQLATR